jgi:hypothetical protein
MTAVIAMFTGLALTGNALQGPPKKVDSIKIESVDDPVKQAKESLAVHLDACLKQCDVCTLWGLLQLSREGEINETKIRKFREDYPEFYARLTAITTILELHDELDTSAGKGVPLADYSLDRLAAALPGGEMLRGVAESLKPQIMSSLRTVHMLHDKDCVAIGNKGSERK